MWQVFSKRADSSPPTERLPNGNGRHRSVGTESDISFRPKRKDEVDRWTTLRLRWLARLSELVKLCCYRCRGIQAGGRDCSIVTSVARRWRLAVCIVRCRYHVVDMVDVELLCRRPGLEGFNLKLAQLRSRGLTADCPIIKAHEQENKYN